MIKLIDVYKKLDPINNIDKLEVRNQSTNDIINQVLSQHLQNSKEAKKIAYLFDGGNLYETCKNIWNFLKYEVPYKVEPSDKQTTKTLSRMLFDALNGKGNDCKHYAGFSGAILSALGYNNWKYRFAGYSKYINVPTHVYCYANDNNGVIYIDAVINGFDLEKPFVLNIDKKINSNMSLYKLSGIDEPEISGLSDIWNAGKKKLQQAGNFVKETADQAADKARAAAKQAAEFTKKEAERIKNQVAQGAKTIGLAIPRNAFLLLVGQNVFNLAGRLRNETFDSLKWWTNDWGGNRTDLFAAIQTGKNKSRIFGFDYNDIIYPSQIGMIGEPITISSAIASSAVIYKKIEPYLEKLDKLNKTFDKGKDFYNKNKTLIDGAIDQGKKDFQKATGVKIEDVLWKKEDGKTGEKNQLSIEDVKSVTPLEAQKVADALTGNKPKFNLDNKTMILIGGGALALLLILKKK